jgi:hypothetical protein
MGLATSGQRGSGVPGVVVKQAVASSRPQASPASPVAQHGSTGSPIQVESVQILVPHMTDVDPSDPLSAGAPEAPDDPALPAEPLLPPAPPVDPPLPALPALPLPPLPPELLPPLPPDPPLPDESSPPQPRAAFATAIEAERANNHVIDCFICGRPRRRLIGATSSSVDAPFGRRAWRFSFLGRTL